MTAWRRAWAQWVQLALFVLSARASSISKLPQHIMSAIDAASPVARQHVLIGQADEDCNAPLQEIGFPGQLAESRHLKSVKVADAATALNLTSCSHLAYLSPELAIRPEAFDVFQPESADDLQSYVRSWLTVHVTIFNDLPIDIKVEPTNNDKHNHWALEPRRLGPSENLMFFVPTGQIFVFRSGQTVEGIVKEDVVVAGVEVMEDCTLRLSQLVEWEEGSLAPGVWTLQEQAAERIREAREEMDVERFELMDNFTKTTPRFTHLGWQQGQAPSDLFNDILTFFSRRWPAKEILEEYPILSANLNYLQAPTRTVVMTHALKKKVIRALQPLLEEWTGKALELVSCYGIRLYSNGSILYEHVDRLVIPSVGAIINVAQDVDETWPLIVTDHQGRRNVIPSKPGDMIFYEGSSCPHGRPVPMKGRHYANLFVIFKPAGMAVAVDA